MTIKTFLLSCIVTLSMLSHRVVAEQSIDIAFSEYKPYSSQTLPNQGVLNDIVRQSFALEGVVTNFKVMSPSKMFRSIKMGKIDAAIGWSPSEERKLFADFSSPIIHSKVVLFYRKNNPIHWSKLPTTKSAVFGVTKTYFYGEQFELARQQGLIDVQVANSDKINFKKLIGTRIDAFPIALDVGRDILKRKFSKRQSKGLAFSSQELYREPLTLMFSKKRATNKKFMATFKRGFNKLKKNGSYQKILQNFNTRLNIQR